VAVVEVVAEGVEPRPVAEPLRQAAVEAGAVRRRVEPRPVAEPLRQVVVVGEVAPRLVVLQRVEGVEVVEVVVHLLSPRQVPTRTSSSSRARGR
jgi:hypothetical protein